MSSKPTPVAVIIDECAAMDHAQDGTDQNLAARLIERDNPELRTITEYAIQSLELSLVLATERQERARQTLAGVRSARRRRGLARHRAASERVEHLRAALDLAREILGQGEEVKT